MADKFLNTGGSGNSNISNGTATIFGATIGGDNLIASKPIKTNSTKQLISTNLDIADINSLQSELEVKPNLTLIKNDTQTNPATNGIKLYAKLDGNLYKRDSNGTESGFGGASSLQQIYNGSTPALITTATTKPLILQTGSADTDTLIACSDLVGTKNFSVKANGEMVVKKIKSTTGNIDLEVDDTIFNLASSTKSIKIIPSTNTIDFYNGSSKVGGLTTGLSGIYNDMTLTTNLFSVKSLTASEDFFRVWNQGTYTSFEMKDGGGSGRTLSRLSTNGGVGNPNTFNIESFYALGVSDGNISIDADTSLSLNAGTGQVLCAQTPTTVNSVVNKTYVDNLATPYDLMFAATDEVNTITTTGQKISLRVPQKFTTSKIKISVNTAGGTNFEVRIAKNGTSVASVNQGNFVITNTSNTTIYIEDEIITVEVLNVGSGTATGLKIYLIGETTI